MALNGAQVVEVTGVPLLDTVDGPRLEYSGRGTLLFYTVAEADGGGTAVVQFESALAVHIGSPNDEALHGHPLWTTGLQHYAFQEVMGSDWAAELERRNRCHPMHDASRYRSLRHFILTFHDVTFECVAEGFMLTRRDNGEGASA